MAQNTKANWIKKAIHKDTLYKTSEIKTLRKTNNRRFRRANKQGKELEIIAVPSIWYF